MKDLAVLVSDKNMDFALQGILGRPQSLGIRSLSHEITSHSGRDGGARASGPDMLALLKNQFRHGLLILDWEGSGSDLSNAPELERSLDDRLTRTWGSGSKTIVIDPELDSWIWGADNLMKVLLDWEEDCGVREWLEGHGFVLAADGKPARPKEAIEALTAHLRLPRSSALYRKITSRISLKNCTDPAFLRLRDTLKKWFSIS